MVVILKHSIKKCSFIHSFFLGVVSCLVAFNLTNFLENDLKNKTPDVLVPYTIITVLGSVTQTFLWFTPSIVVEMILKDFSANCRNTTIELENICRNLLLNYEKLENAFGNFFLIQFTTAQLVMVLCPFLRKVVFENHKLITSRMWPPRSLKISKIATWKCLRSVTGLYQLSPPSLQSLYKLS